MSEDNASILYKMVKTMVKKQESFDKSCMGTAVNNQKRQMKYLQSIMWKEGMENLRLIG